MFYDNIHENQVLNIMYLSTNYMCDAFTWGVKDNNW